MIRLSIGPSLLRLISEHFARYKVLLFYLLAAIFKYLTEG
jgi:hypothetical protein